MPYSAANKLHRRWAERVVFGEFELSSEYSALERSATRALNQGFPVEHVIFRHWARGDALRWVGGEVLVFVKQALLGDCGSHFVEFGGKRQGVEFVKGVGFVEESGLGWVPRGGERWSPVESAETDQEVKLDGV